VKLDEASRRHADSERKLTEAHRSHLQDIATQQRTERDRLAHEHEAALRWLEDKHRQDLLQQQDESALSLPRYDSFCFITLTFSFLIMFHIAHIAVNMLLLLSVCF